MKLQRITDQEGESLQDYFEELGGWPHPGMRSFADRMIALIQCLERDVDAPLHWATTSHYWFYLSLVDHWDPCKARVFVYARREGFEIRYRSTEAFLDWDRSFCVVHATDVADACRAIARALNVAVVDPQGRFDRQHDASL